jgi:hypothetical protein
MTRIEIFCTHCGQPLDVPALDRVVRERDIMESTLRAIAKPGVVRRARLANETLGLLAHERLDRARRAAA